LSVYMKYPNYRGMVFSDQSQTAVFNVVVKAVDASEPATPTVPAGFVLGDLTVNTTVTKESDASVLTTQTVAAQASFDVSVDVSGMESNVAYLVTTTLMHGADVAGTYPAYRIYSKPAAVRTAATLAFDDKNRFTFSGTKHFMLGLYAAQGDSISYAAGFFEPFLQKLWKLWDMPNNVWLNYWYGGVWKYAGVSDPRAMQNLLTTLASHGKLHLETANCGYIYDTGQNSIRNKGFLYPTESDAFLRNLASYPGWGGWYVGDECDPQTAPTQFAYSQHMAALDPDGITFQTNYYPDAMVEMQYWRDSADVPGMDPYPLYGAGPDYALNKVSLGTLAIKAGVMNSRPTVPTLQYFTFLSTGRFPSQDETRNMSWMAIADGANGLFYWSTGAGKTGTVAATCADVVQDIGAQIPGTTGSFSYINVVNTGNTPTSGTITATVTMPAGLTLVSLAQTGWTCVSNSCTRSDSLAPYNPLDIRTFYPLTLFFNVAADAADYLTYHIDVSGGGSVATGSVYDPVMVSAADAPKIYVVFYGVSPTPPWNHSASAAPYVARNGTGSYVISVLNGGTLPTTGEVTMTLAMPTGLTMSSVTGDGWTCGGTTTITCTRSDALPAPTLRRSAYPDIIVKWTVDADAPGSVQAVATVTGGGSPVDGITVDGGRVIDGTAQAKLNVTSGHIHNFDWCPRRTTLHNSLKAVLTEISSLDSVLMSDDDVTSLTNNTESNIHTRVKSGGGFKYLIASNITATTLNPTFTWHLPMLGIQADSNSGSPYTVASNVNTFTDTFGPYAAHIYKITEGTPPDCGIIPTSLGPYVIGQTVSAVLYTMNCATDTWDVTGSWPSGLTMTNGFGGPTGAQFLTGTVAGSPGTFTPSVSYDNAVVNYSIVVNPGPTLKDTIGGSKTTGDVIK
jgi:hypothetical protein